MLTVGQICIPTGSSINKNKMILLLSPPPLVQVCLSSVASHFSHLNVMQRSRYEKLIFISRRNLLQEEKLLTEAVQRLPELWMLSRLRLLGRMSIYQTGFSSTACEFILVYEYNKGLVSFFFFSKQNEVLQRGE